MKTYHDIATDGGSDVAGQVASQSHRLTGRLADVRRIVAVMSGKGGVGKSTVSVNLAASLAVSGARVGLVDGDINGPSLGRMAGVHGAPVLRSGSAVLPVESSEGVRVMSMDLFLDDESLPVVWDAPDQVGGAAWRGLREAGALRELIADTQWGELDVLLIDLPPGSDRLPTLAGVVPRLDGALVVTLPSAVSLGVVGRSVRMVQDHLDVPPLGLIENMAAHVCPSCGASDELFPAGKVDVLARTLGLRVLARIPFDPLLGRAADEGRSYPHDHPDRPAAEAFNKLANELQAILDLP
jgi:ATP-binding protein involved in chromosome partitioning